MSRRRYRGGELLLRFELEVDLLRLGTTADEPQDQPLQCSVEHVREQRGEEELSWQEDETDDRGDENETRRELTKRSPTDDRNSRVRDVAHHEHREQSHETGQ